MSPRRRSGGQGGGRRGKANLIAKLVAAAAVVAVAVIAANYVYFYRAELKHFFSTPKPPDAAALDKAITEAYARLKPVKVTTSPADPSAHQVARDRVEIAKAASLLRANSEITSAVEKAGGLIAYGIESSDNKGRKTGVTLAVSNGQTIVREISVERGKK